MYQKSSASFKWQRPVALGSAILFILYLLETSFVKQYAPERSYKGLKVSQPYSADKAWLIGTSITASNIQRRMMIRDTWQRLYKNDSIITTRFILSNPDELWAPVIEAENMTYGDITILPNVIDSKATATTIKPFEWYKALVAGSQRWAFISKIDEDSFLDATTFYREYLHPRLSTQGGRLTATNRTVIGRTLYKEGYTLPGGQFFALSWDVVERLTELYTRNPITNDDEDTLVGRYLYEANEKWQHIDLPNPVAFDYEAKELLNADSAFAARGANLNEWTHAVGPGAINPHKMKKDEDYLKVAACYDEDGLIDPGW
jgi:hypothetical protein